MDTDRPVVQNPVATDVSSGPLPSIALVRARLVDGDIAGARVAIDQLTASNDTNPELPLTEAMLLEAEGRLEEALTCLRRIVASTAGSAWTVALSHIRIARLATRLERVDLAEASAIATLSANPEDVDGLRALAFVRRRDEGSEAHLQALRRLASAPAAEEADVWQAIEAFAGLERWAAVLELFAQHEFELDPWRMTPLRVRAFIELGWHRRAHRRLVKAYADEYIRGCEAVELLVECGALALAADFICGSMSADPWLLEARALVSADATRACEDLSVHEAPLRYADAIQALGILFPGKKETDSAIGRALRVLTETARNLLANDDPVGATQWLVAAVRLAPADRALLESLADAAHRANLTERYLDTLLRIWTTHRDVSALLATARGVLETSSWAMISEVMTIAAAEATSLGLDLAAVAEQFREQACRKVDEYIRDGDVVAGLELVIRLPREFPGAQWPEVLVSRLLRATKRRLRSQRGGEALTVSVGPLYLELAPRDVDICRMMARVRMRQGRTRDARGLLDRVVTVSPHVAGDWVSLAMVQAEMADVEGRDISVARAILIAPDVDLPPGLAAVRERMRLL